MHDKSKGPSEEGVSQTETVVVKIMQQMASDI